MKSVISPKQPPVATSSIQPNDGETCELVVAFADIVGSTHLSETLKLEEYDQLLTDYQEVCFAEIAARNGYVAQAYGDGVLSYFHLRQNKKDAASQAIMAGLSIALATEKLSYRFLKTVAVRVAIHVGTVRIKRVGPPGREELLAIGEVPNVAAKLQTLAKPNSVVVSDPVYLEVGEAFACKLLGSKHLPGLSHRMNVYHVARRND